MLIPMEIMVFLMPAPSTDTKASASRKPGNASMASVARWIPKSIFPPKYPDTRPSGTPMKRPTATTPTAMSSETLAP
jgi:hypothetical protein